MEAFLSKLHMLFVDGHCSRHGFTQWALTTMRWPLLLYVGNKPICIGKRGGVDADILARATGRMACWARLCKEVVQAEYPHFHLFAAFGAFRLPADTSEAREGSGRSRKRAIGAEGIQSTILTSSLRSFVR